MSKENSKPQTVSPFEMEQTAIGVQFLIGDVKPVTHRQKLEFITTLPMQPKRASQQKPCNIGLFDEVSRNQMDFF